jgi:hypothetical protein
LTFECGYLAEPYNRNGHLVQHLAQRTAHVTFKLFRSQLTGRSNIGHRPPLCLWVVHLLRAWCKTDASCLGELCPLHISSPHDRRDMGVRKHPAADSASNHTDQLTVCQGSEKHRCSATRPLPMGGGDVLPPAGAAPAAGHTSDMGQHQPSGLQLQEHVPLDSSHGHARLCTWRMMHTAGRTSAQATQGLCQVRHVTRGRRSAGAHQLCQVRFVGLHGRAGRRCPHDDVLCPPMAAAEWRCGAVLPSTGGVLTAACCGATPTAPDTDLLASCPPPARLESCATPSMPADKCIGQFAAKKQHLRLLYNVQ